MAQLRIPLDEKRFNSGLTWKDYLAQMGDTKPRTEENYSKAGLTDDERKFFSGIGQVKYVLMRTATPLKSADARCACSCATSTRT